MPAFREDKFSAERTKYRFHVEKNMVEQSSTVPNRPYLGLDLMTPSLVIIVRVNLNS